MNPKNKQLLDSFFDRKTTALAKIISIIENRSDGHEEILSALFPQSRNAYRIGLTGPPGAGKSTIADKIALHPDMVEKEIGIIAVDPTSPFTGGAVLGDRIRMRDLAMLENIFIRSMATRGSLGGLAAATKDVVVALDSFGKELILVETVGVGQVELDIVDACDSTIVILTPESGDSVQALKAGLLEIADIFVVNKSDRQGADLFASDLRSILEMKDNGNSSNWKIPIVSTIATRDEGIDELVEQIENHRKFITQNGHFEEHRKLQIRHKIREIIELRIKEIAEQKFLNIMDIETISHRVFEGEIDPYTAVKECLKLKKIW